MAQTTTIEDSGSKLKITIGSSLPRNIFKAQIIDITVIKTNIIKIDIGQGALHNIFIPYADVSQPATASPTDLSDTISAMLDTTDEGSGGDFDGIATEAKQDSEIAQLSTLNGIVSSQLNALNVSITQLEGKTDNEISLIGTLNNAVNGLKGILEILNDKWFYEPLRIDDGGAGVVYKGYTITPGANDEQMVWAISRETKDDHNGVHIIAWANGERTFINRWMNREGLDYQ